MNDQTETKAQEIRETLGLDREHTARRKWRWAVLAVMVAAAGGIFYMNAGKMDVKIRYVTQTIEKGSLTTTVLATGNLEPTKQVDVGIEVSGTIESVYVDYNDPVKKGRVLARLDTAKLEARVMQSRAALSLAEAGLMEAKAGLREAKSNLGRAEKLSAMTGAQTPSQKEMDALNAAYARALAKEQNALAQIGQAKAALMADESDLEKAVIRSPIDGVVLVRNVEPGQTVAASMQTPVLFKLAEDLTKMELFVGVDEADIGSVRAGQQAHFSVDAYPDKSFEAVITKVRLTSKTVEGVVTYEAVLQVDNSQLLLRPGMTATAEIVVNVVKDTVLVPNAALRYMPPGTEDARKPRTLFTRLLPQREKEDDKRKKPKGGQQVWVLKGEKAVGVAVKTGETDGFTTSVIEGDIKPGDAVIVNDEEM